MQCDCYFLATLKHDMQKMQLISLLNILNEKQIPWLSKANTCKDQIVINNSIIELTYSVAYGIRRFNAAFTRALQ
jgi:hypothetical protein